MHYLYYLSGMNEWNFCEIFLHFISSIKKTNIIFKTQCTIFIQIVGRLESSIISRGGCDFYNKVVSIVQGT